MTEYYTIQYLEFVTNKEIPGCPSVPVPVDFNNPPPFNLNTQVVGGKNYYPKCINIGAKFYNLSDKDTLRPNADDVVNVWLIAGNGTDAYLSIFPFRIGEDLKMIYSDYPPYFEDVATYSLCPGFFDIGRKFVTFNPENPNLEINAGSCTTYKTQNMSPGQQFTAEVDELDTITEIFHVVSGETPGGKIMKWDKTWKVSRSLINIFFVDKGECDNPIKFDHEGGLVIAVYKQTCELVAESRTVYEKISDPTEEC